MLPNQCICVHTLPTCRRIRTAAVSVPDFTAQLRAVHDSVHQRFCRWLAVCAAGNRRNCRWHWDTHSTFQLFAQNDGGSISVEVPAAGMIRGCQSLLPNHGSSWVFVITVWNSSEILWYSCSLNNPDALALSSSVPVPPVCVSRCPQCTASKARSRRPSKVQRATRRHLRLGLRGRHRRWLCSLLSPRLSHLRLKHSLQVLLSVLNLQLFPCLRAASLVTAGVRARGAA